MTRKRRFAKVNFLFSMILAAGALFYFAYSQQPSVEPIRELPAAADASPEQAPAVAESETAAENSTSQAMRPDQFYAKQNAPVTAPNGAVPPTAAGAGVNANPAIYNQLPEDLKRQLQSPPPELPEDLKRQLEGPPPELPPDLKAQLNAPPPELPEDIKRALQTPPRIVSLEEVNNPPQPGF